MFKKRTVYHNVLGFFVIALVVLFTLSMQAWGGVEDYAGTYSGLFNGTDNGTWIARVESDGTCIGIAWSNMYEAASYGSGTVNASGDGSWFISTGAYMEGHIDGSGVFTGTWNNSYTGDSGTLTGSKSDAAKIATYSGTYEGTFSGDDTGSWTITAESTGYCSGTGWSGIYNENIVGEGGINENGLFIILTDSGSSLTGTVDESYNVEGIWHIAATGDRGLIDGAKKVSVDSGGGGGGGGGCFISTLVH